MDSEDGEFFIKQLATFVRTHEKALANALQFSRRQNPPRHGSSQSVSSIATSTVTSTSMSERPATSASASSTSSIAAALSLGTLSLTSQTMKSAKLALTPHHLFYLLSRFEELGIPVGPMKVRLENLHDSTTSANYVSFLGQSQRSKSRGSDVGSIRSVSSIRSVMSSMSALWASFGIGSSVSSGRAERQKIMTQGDLKYLYSAFTKIPCLKLAPDWRARLIRGYEEFPFDSAVPLYVFKNVQALELCDIDFRQFFGWDRLADQLRSLTLKRASIEDPADILIDIVLDDMDKRRRRSSKSQASPTTGLVGTSASPRRSSPPVAHSDLHKPPFALGSPNTRHSTGDLYIGSLNSEGSLDQRYDTAIMRDDSGRRPSLVRADSDEPPKSPSKSGRPRSHSPRRPPGSRNGASHVRSAHKVRRSGSGSSHSSLSDSWHMSRASASNLASMGILPSSKWRFLKHLCLADNSLTSIPAASLFPLSNTLHSLDLSSNLFTQIPDSLASLTALRALNLSHCMIDSLHSLTRNPLPAITAMNLRGNRLQSLAAIEKLFPLERLDLRDNRLSDPLELARLTGIPDIREIWVEGNPFTRTHRDYRITIFNLFRKTPGYTEDVMIDATGPSYSERKYLVDRAPLPPAVPVVKPVSSDMPAVNVVKPAIIYDAPREPAVLRKERPAAKTTASESNTSSSRRRRAPKRRIVDLATNEQVGALHSASGQPHAVPVARSDAPRPALTQEGYHRALHDPDQGLQQQQQAAAPTLVSPVPAVVPVLECPRRPSLTHYQNHHNPQNAHQLPTPSAAPRLNTEVARQPNSPATVFPSPEIQSPWREAQQEWDVGGELYRRRIEALRDRVGPGYLSVLSEEGYAARPPSHCHDVHFSGPNSPIISDVVASASRAATVQPIIHSGRTLG